MYLLILSSLPCCPTVLTRYPSLQNSPPQSFSARWIRLILTAMLASAFVALGSSFALAQEVITDPGFVPNEEDPTYDLTFQTPPQHIEAADVAAKSGLFKAYKLPAPDGNSRSFITVAFQKKSDQPGLSALSEFVNINLRTFKNNFPNGVIARVNIQGRIPAKLDALGFPLQMYMFKGNDRPGSSSGDALVLFLPRQVGFGQSLGPYLGSSSKKVFQCSSSRLSRA